jgi:hypothetical protein
MNIPGDSESISEARNRSEGRKQLCLDSSEPRPDSEYGRLARCPRLVAA